MSGHDIVTVGASAGGVEALTTLVRGLPADFPASLFVVLHIPAQSPSMLPTILSRVGPLPAVQATNYMPIEQGRIYVAAPDHHLLVDRDVVRVVRGPKENRHRPAIDPLMRTAARAYGPRCVGVVLSGSLDDGTAGLLAIKQRGGVAVVQDPDEALYDSMPRSALAHVAVDHCSRLADMGRLLARLASQTAASEALFPVPEQMEREARIAFMDSAELQSNDHPGTPSPFACPECGGVLWETNDGDLTRFRCRVGHAFSPESVLAQQSEQLEEALWVALRALEERASLSRRLSDAARAHSRTTIADRFAEREHEARSRAEVIRQVLLRGDDPQAADD